MKQFEPEIGQAVFGQPYKTYAVSDLCRSALNMIRDTMDRVMWNINQKEYENPFSNSGNNYEGTVFKVCAYDWNEDNKQSFNFKYKDIEISWYKYLGRGMSCNKDLTYAEINTMLIDCLTELRELDLKHFEETKPF